MGYLSGSCLFYDTPDLQFCGVLYLPMWRKDTQYSQKSSKIWHRNVKKWYALPKEEKRGRWG